MKHVIIGVGAAGIMAAKTIRESDPAAEIMMISEDRYVHSRCMLHKYIGGERTEEGLNFAGRDFFERFRISWLRGCSVESIQEMDHTVCLKTGDGELQTETYDKLLIATGANSFIPPVGQLREAENVFGLRHLRDAELIREAAANSKKAVVIGSGLVGLDAASGLLERGLEVSVVEMADRILPIQLDATAASAYQRLFEQAGCRFYLGKKAAETYMDSSRKIYEIVLDDGTGLKCDFVIVAAGVRPAVQAAKGTSFEAERFIEVNEYMQTVNPDVYAAGDVTGLSGIWPNAQKMGRTAGFHMVGIAYPYTDRYAMKNTINFYGLPTLSLGNGKEEAGDTVLVREDRSTYRKAVIRDGKLNSIVLQGCIDYSGIYQYLIKNEIPLPADRDVFDLSFGDFYGIDQDGRYHYKK